MTPEKFFDYLEGKLPPAERERLERALISNPELQRQFGRPMNLPPLPEPVRADASSPRPLPCSWP